MNSHDDKRLIMKRSPNFRHHSRNDSTRTDSTRIDSTSERSNEDRNKNKGIVPNKPPIVEESKIKTEDNEIKTENTDEKYFIREKKFSGRCQLFVGNIPNDMNDEDFKKLFEKFGACKDMYLCANRGFGFIRMETRHLAEIARVELDGHELRGGRFLRVRMACHTAAIKVKYLSPFISNEILEQTFSMFGEVERAVVIVDDRGKPIGEGIVEFARKQAAYSALKKISEGVFIMTSQPRPISVERYEPNDESDGLPELFVMKTPEMTSERDKGPRFAQPNSMESEMGHKWKKLYQLYKEQEDLLKKNFAEEVIKLEGDQANAVIEQRKHMIMQDVQRRQEELRMLEKTMDDNKRRMEMMRQDDDRKRPHLFEDDMRRGGKEDNMLMHRRVPQEAPPKNQDIQYMNRGMDRSSFAPTLQAPPAPPGIDRIRMGGLGFLANNPGNMGLQPGMRMGLLSRPGTNVNNSGGLLVEPNMRSTQQGMRFDNPPSFASSNGNSNQANPSSAGGGGGVGMMKALNNLPLLSNYSNAVHDPKRQRRY